MSERGWNARAWPPLGPAPLAGQHPAQASLTTDPILELSSLLTHIPRVPTGRHSESPSKRTDQTQTVNSQNVSTAPVSRGPMTCGLPHPSVPHLPLSRPPRPPVLPSPINFWHRRPLFSKRCLQLKTCQCSLLPAGLRLHFSPWHSKATHLGPGLAGALLLRGPSRVRDSP